MNNPLEQLLRHGSFDKENVFNEFRHQFTQINRMSSNDLIILKQTIDIALEMLKQNQSQLTDTQTIQLIHLVKAMQARALYLIKCQLGFHEGRLLHGPLYLHSKSGATTALSIYYSKDTGQILAD
jgi:hypothetical protein